MRLVAQGLLSSQSCAYSPLIPPGLAGAEGVLMTELRKHSIKRDLLIFPGLHKVWPEPDNFLFFPGSVAPGQNFLPSKPSPCQLCSRPLSLMLTQPEFFSVLRIGAVAAGHSPSCLGISLTFLLWSVIFRSFAIYLSAHFFFSELMLDSFNQSV